MEAAYISVFLLSSFRLYLAIGLGAASSMAPGIQLALIAGGTLLLGTIPSVAIALIAGYSPRNTLLFLTGGKLAWILFYLLSLTL